MLSVVEEVSSVLVELSDFLISSCSVCFVFALRRCSASRFAATDLCSRFAINTTWACFFNLYAFLSDFTSCGLGVSFIPSLGVPDDDFDKVDPDFRAVCSVVRDCGLLVGNAGQLLGTAGVNCAAFNGGTWKLSSFVVPSASPLVASPIALALLVLP